MSDEIKVVRGEVVPEPKEREWFIPCITTPSGLYLGEGKNNMPDAQSYLSYWVKPFGSKGYIIRVVLPTGGS